MLLRTTTTLFWPVGLARHFPTAYCIDVIIVCCCKHYSRVFLWRATVQFLLLLSQVSVIVGDHSVSCGAIFMCVVIYGADCTAVYSLQEDVYRVGLLGRAYVGCSHSSIVLSELGKCSPGWLLSTGRCHILAVQKQKRCRIQYDYNCCTIILLLLYYTHS